MGDRFVAAWCSVNRVVDGQEGRAVVDEPNEDGKSDMAGGDDGEEDEEEAGERFVVVPKYLRNAPRDVQEVVLHIMRGVGTLCSAERRP